MAAEDIKPNWLNVARKWQSVCCQQNGFAVVTMRVLIGPGGEPVMWFEPTMQHIEPMRGASIFLHQVLERMVE